MNIIKLWQTAILNRLRVHTYKLKYCVHFTFYFKKYKSEKGLTYKICTHNFRSTLKFFIVGTFGGIFFLRTTMVELKVLYPKPVLNDSLSKLDDWSTLSGSHNTSMIGYSYSTLVWTILIVLSIPWVWDKTYLYFYNEHIWVSYANLNYFQNVSSSKNHLLCQINIPESLCIFFGQKLGGSIVVWDSMDHNMLVNN